MDGVIVTALAVVLIGCWVFATRRHRRSRAVRSADWDSEDGRTELWTSAARCPRCGATGGLAEPSAEGGAVFTCLACGASHTREHRG